MNAPSLSRHLLAWTVGTLVLAWALFAWLGYEAGQHEADELTDGQLATVADVLLSQPSLPLGEGLVRAPSVSRHELKAHDYQQSLSLVIWDRQGRLLAHSGSAPAPAFSTDEGYATLALGTPPVPWRSFARWNDAGDRRLMVLIAESEHDALADDIAGQVSLPAAWFLPVMVLALGLAVMRGLRPLRQLASQVRALDIHQPLHLPHVHYKELRLAVHAINELAARYQAALERERQLADAFAHELRTPLTALGLQVDELRASSAPGQAEALERMDAQVHRANAVLTHLLDLARAGRTALQEAQATVDLAAVAREVVAHHAPAAHAGGRELAYEGPERCEVSGHAVLIGLALRNLVENAMAYSPPGSQVEVRCSPQGDWVQVSDAPREGAPPTSTLHAGSAPLSLGLGLQVVARIAQVHGGRYEQPRPAPGWRRCDRLVLRESTTAESLPA